jgi:carbonic anhydrase
MILPINLHHTLQDNTNIDKAFQANRNYARDFTLGHLSGSAARNLAVITCLDGRLEPEVLLGLKPGDAVIIRNSGGLVTDETLQALAHSYRFAGVREVMVIHHTDCESVAFEDEQLWKDVSGDPTAAVSVQLTGFTDLEKNVREQVRRVKSHLPLAHDVLVKGFVYDVKTGRLRDVSPWEPLAW